ncbi:MAG: hypothetical protein J5762_03200 [Clostridia bacterium]|nr:hypothetical protein [Clostridia bacterium]
MNIVELNEKNLGEALRIFKKTKAEYYEAVGEEIPSDSVIGEGFRGVSGEGITYLFTEKGVCNALVTIDKPIAEIRNFSIDFSALGEADLTKILEFTVKQFSAITLVFIWITSLDNAVMDLIEGFGFEYTGEQDYIDKDKFLSAYKYVYRRKK